MSLRRAGSSPSPLEAIRESTKTKLAARKGNWFQTHSGIQFWPIDPRPEDICLEDIAHALAGIWRFGGHVWHYSVAQHSVHVCDHLPPALKAQGLLHDATEAYLGDVIRPLKPFLSGYAELEGRMARCIGERFGLELAELPVEVKLQDERALFTEKRDLRGPTPAPWPHPKEPWEETLHVWPTFFAKATFLARAHSLGIR